MEFCFITVRVIIWIKLGRDAKDGSQALIKASQNDSNYKPSIKEFNQYNNLISTNIAVGMGKDKLLQRSKELKIIGNKYFSNY